MARVRRGVRRKGGAAAPRTRKVGDWAKARKILPGLDRIYKQAEVESIRKEAEHFRRMVIKAFRTGGTSNGKAWAKNSGFTTKMKGSSKPLIDKGDLMGSITIVETGPAAFFVGVPNKARSKDGTKLVRIGAVHEFGHVIVMQITKKQHRFFMAKLKKMGGGGGGGAKGGGFRPGATLVIKIPQRSFLVATKEAHFDGGKSERRVKRRIAAKMRQATGSLKGQQAK